MLNNNELCEEQEINDNLGIDEEEYDDIEIEEMSDFFSARVEGYDEHMINDVEGCKDGYIKMAEIVPSETKCLLDLGCGTGLELKEIFKKCSNLTVTCVDMTKAMLDKLKEKYFDKNINIVQGNYLEYDFGVDKYDVAISFQTMHHLSHEEKLGLYKKIYNSLKPNGMYIECDYMVIDQEEENFYYEELVRFRKEQNLKHNEFYHYDTPCTIDNQIKFFKATGFDDVKQIWRVENTTIIVAKKNI